MYPAERHADDDPGPAPPSESKEGMLKSQSAH